MFQHSSAQPAPRGGRGENYERAHGSSRARERERRLRPRKTADKSRPWGEGREGVGLAPRPFSETRGMARVDGI